MNILATLLIGYFSWKWWNSIIKIYYDFNKIFVCFIFWSNQDAYLRSLFYIIILTTVHPFLYMHFGFWILRIAIWLTWNNYYNITNLPDYTWVKWNGFLALISFSICSQIQLHSAFQLPHYLHMIQVRLFSALAH